MEYLTWGENSEEKKKKKKSGLQTANRPLRKKIYGKKKSQESRRVAEKSHLLKASILKTSHRPAKEQDRKEPKSVG